jgi:hypothetical protein
MTLMIFVGGLGAPSLRIGQVYNMPRRHIGFSYFEPAPEGMKEGEWRQINEDFEPHRNPAAPVVEYTGDSSIDPRDYSMVPLRFRFCKSAPSGYRSDEIVMLPRRYARLPWWTEA